MRAHSAENGDSPTANQKTEVVLQMRKILHTCEFINNFTRAFKMKRHSTNIQYRLENKNIIVPTFARATVSHIPSLSLLPPRPHPLPHLYHFTSIIEKITTPFFHHRPH